MATPKNLCLINSFMKCCLVFCLMVLMVAGCTSEPKQFDDSIKGPQVIVEPSTLHLGIIRILTKDIFFKGKGFSPGEGYCVDLTGLEDSNREIDVPICCGTVDEEGNFSDKAQTLVKADYLLNADVTTGKKGYLIIINRPPIPQGSYLATAKGFDSKKSAQTRITIEGPTLKDHLMDWVGQLFGKVKKE
jgi:hypothetical protein